MALSVEFYIKRYFQGPSADERPLPVGLYSSPDFSLPVSHSLASFPVPTCRSVYSLPHSVPFFRYPLVPLSLSPRKSVPFTRSLFSVLTCLLLCGPKLVSSPCSVCFFPHPDLSIDLCSSEGEYCECPSLSLFSFCVLTRPLLCSLRRVSALCSLCFFLHPDLSDTV